MTGVEIYLMFLAIVIATWVFKPSPGIWFFRVLFTVPFLYLTVALASLLGFLDF